jgi:hypothetical protein
MTSMTGRRMTVLVLAVCGFAAGAAPALAQAEKEPPLKGPPVKTNRPPALEDRFAPGRGERGGAPAQRGMAGEEFGKILAKLRAEDAPADVRLTPEQDQKIREIQQEFRRRARDAGQSGQREARPGKGNKGEGEPMEEGQGKRARRPQDADRKGPDDARGDAPRPQDMMTKVYAVLTEPQQRFVKDEMEKRRKEIEEKRGEEYVKRRMEERRKGREAEGVKPGTKGEPGAPGAEGRPPERLRRIGERLRELPPEERERILRLVESELEKAESGK